MLIAVEPSLSRFKYLKFSDEKTVDLQVELSVTDGTVAIEAFRPLKGLVLTTNDEARLMDNFIDLVPGDKVVVGIRGATEKTKLGWSHCSSFS
jgi:beta-mannosidase